MTEANWWKQFCKSVVFILLAFAVLAGTMIFLAKTAESVEEENAKELENIKLSETVSQPPVLVEAFPVGKYKTFRPRRLSILPKNELPIASSITKPYNKFTDAFEEPKEWEPIYGTVEVPDNAELVYLGEFYITGYDVCMECCGKVDGITACGAQATVGRTVAATNDFAFGTVLYIDGIGARVVEDRGGMKGDHLDVLCEDHPACYAITGYYEVWEVVTDEMP